MDIRKRIGGIEYDLRALLDELDDLQRQHDKEVARLEARIAELTDALVPLTLPRKTARVPR
jgi:hypothetical protein